ncbi:hypothetical protein DPMN_046152 [Dreissena polymorpha]|uniref:Uncharacterized protein n=1 Tax=Dreissena polymorpha TaxID=45954 RepID=A0A9D4D6B4_DREPO|nr:hypothetical protein DPMN_046152 [Dreissena polymorpha]
MINILHHAAKKSIPNYRKRKILETAGRSIWNRDIGNSSKKCKELFKKRKDTGSQCEESKRLMKSEKTKLRSLQRRAHADVTRRHVNKLMQASESDQKMVNAQRKVVNDHGSTTFSMLDDNKYLQPNEILSIWKNHFETLATPPISEDPNDNIHLQNEIIYENEIQSGKPLQKVSNKEIEEAIRSLNTGKAPDRDGIAAAHN